MSAAAANRDDPRNRLRAAFDWAVLICGVGSLAFAILATTTGIVSADDNNGAAQAVLAAAD